MDDLGNPADGITHVTAEFGVQDRRDVPEVLHHLADRNAERVDEALDPDEASGRSTR